jgi:hypothetical protein
MGEEEGMTQEMKEGCNGKGGGKKSHGVMEEEEERSDVIGNVTRDFPA